MKQHLKNIWQIGSLSLIWFLLLIFGLFTKDWNLTKISLALSIVFLFVFLYFLWRASKQEAQEIKAVLRALQNILNPLTEGIIIYRENKVLFANEKLLSLTNLSLDEILNLNLGTWLTENPRYQLLGDIFFPFVRGENVELLGKEPEVLRVSFQNPERHFFIIYTNIQLEQPYEMRVIIDQTKEIIQRREEKEFISLITHHLRTPLNHIRWFLEALPEKSLDEAERANLQLVRGTVNQLIFIVELLLLFASAEEKVVLQTKMVSIKNVIERIIQNLRPLIEQKRLTFKVNIDAQADSIVADERLFYLTLYTLLENAVIYNKDAGEVEVKVDLIKEKPYSLITVQDTGIGIPENEIGQIFQKHFRGSNAKKIKAEGLGLGLYLTKKIINWHGAEIKVSSKENEGTKFEITWPRKPELIPQT